MDKTLETVALVHRVIIVASLALFLVGISTEHPNPVYDAATAEIDTLQEGIKAVSEQVNKAYNAIYDKSELKAATLTWLQRQQPNQRKIDISVISPKDFAVPDSTSDPLVTLDNQLKWANRVYRDLDYPFFLCEVDRDQLQHSLDRTVGSSPKRKFRQINVYVEANAGRSGQFDCKIEAQFEVQKGTIIAIHNSFLNVPTTVVNVIQVEPPGPKWFDLSVEDTFKEHGLGDWEDSQALVVPSLWGLWTDLGPRSPAAAEAFLQQKKEEEAERLKEKIDILGESLNRSLTIIMTAIVELCLMIYLLAYVVQVRCMTPEYKRVISESSFYGVMRTTLGKLVMLSSFVITWGVCFFALIIAFPSFRQEWLGPQWIAAGITRYFLVAFIGVIDLLLIWGIHSTVVTLQLGELELSGDAEAKTSVRT